MSLESRENILNWPAFRSRVTIVKQCGVQTQRRTQPSSHNVPPFNLSHHTPIALNAWHNLCWTKCTTWRICVPVSFFSQCNPEIVCKFFHNYTIAFVDNACFYNFKCWALANPSEQQQQHWLCFPVHATRVINYGIERGCFHHAAAQHTNTHRRTNDHGMSVSGSNRSRESLLVMVNYRMGWCLTLMHCACILFDMNKTCLMTRMQTIMKSWMSHEHKRLSHLWICY